VFAVDISSCVDSISIRKSDLSGYANTHWPVYLAMAEIDINQIPKNNRLNER
jgi:hypothetical protein